jgi:hypothetical protein
MYKYLFYFISMTIILSVLGCQEKDTSKQN